MQRTNQKEFRIEKVIKKIGWVLNGKAVIIISIFRLRKKTLSKMIQYFPKRYNCFGRNGKLN